MADTPRKPKGDTDGFDKPFLTPNGEDGFGPTLGEDVGAKRQREEDRKNNATSVVEKDA